MAANNAIKTKPGSALTDRASKPCTKKENMTLTILNTNAVLTMTSREIAELTGKQHGHVRRDIENMLEELELLTDGYIQFWIDPQNGKSYPEYALDRELTETLLTGYSAKLRRKVIARWHELESKSITPAFAIPTTLSAALRLAADQSDQIDAQLVQLAIAAPKVAALDLIESADGMLNLQAAGKTLQQKPNKFIQWLRENNWIYKRPGSSSNCARAEKFNAGYLTTKAHTVIQPDGTERVREQVMVTAKGLTKLAGVFAQ